MVFEINSVFVCVGLQLIHRRSSGFHLLVLLSITQPSPIPHSCLRALPSSTSQSVPTRRPPPLEVDDYKVGLRVRLKGKCNAPETIWFQSYAPPSLLLSLALSCTTESCSEESNAISFSKGSNVVLPANIQYGLWVQVMGLLLPSLEWWEESVVRFSPLLSEFKEGYLGTILNAAFYTIGVEFGTFLDHKLSFLALWNEKLLTLSHIQVSGTWGSNVAVFLHHTSHVLSTSWYACDKIELEGW